MDWADDVTYAVHDMDDFYRAGLVPLDLLTSEAEELLRFTAYLRGRFAADGERLATACDRLFGGFVSSIRTPFRGRTEDRVHLRTLGSTLIGRYIAAVQLVDAGDGRRVEYRITEELRDEVQVLKALTWFYVIDRPSLAVIQRGQARMIGTLYDMYQSAAIGAEHHIFPPEYAERVRHAEGTAQRRAVVDLIAGMTEATVAEIYRQQMGVSNGSLLLGAATSI